MDAFDSSSDEHQPCTLWRSIHDDLKPQMQAALACLIQVLQNSDLIIAQHLVSGVNPDPSAHTSNPNDSTLIPRETFKPDMKLIENLLLASSGDNLKLAHDQFIALSMVVGLGNQKQVWNLPLPPIPTLIQREKNPIQPTNFPMVSKARIWEATILQSISRETNLSERAQVGRILCSALFRCGLLQINALDTFLTQLHEPIMVVHERSYINLALRKLGHDNAEKRRVFLDPCTESLMLCHELSLPESSPKNAWAYMKKFLSESGVAREGLPSNITEMIEGAACLLHLYIPPFLISYGRRKTVSHALKHHAWLRLNHIQAPHKTTSTVKISPPHSLDNDAAFVETLDCYGRTVWEQNIATCLKEDSAKSALAQLALLQASSVITDAPPIGKYMIDWAVYLFEHGTKTSKKLKPARVKADIASLAPRIYGFIANDDLVQWNIEAYEEVYSQILEDASSNGVRKKLANRLREFHYYMRKIHGAPELDSSLLAVANSISEVDANIISIEEYTATLEHLEKGPLNFMFKDLPLIAQIITMISFRCGLRRSEVLKLRLVDIQGKVNPEIILRPHATRGLKTGNSTRRVLIHYLLEPNELETLLSWVDKRRNQEKNASYSPFVFCIPEMNISCLSANMIFSHIHHALREVSGDPSLRFHHFRHSSATWNFLRLMIADQGMIEGFFDHLPATKAWLDKSQAFKNALYKHDNPTRKHLYAMTNHMGHSSPEMTLEHYIHFCDILLNQSLSNVFKPPNAKHWQSIAKIPKATAHRLVNKGSALPMLKKIRKSKNHAVAVIHMPKKMVQTQSDTQSASFVYIQIMQTWELLYLHSKHEMTVDHLVERYSFSVPEINNMITAAAHISTIPSKQVLRHRMIKPDKPSDRLICPSGIKGEAAKLLAQDFLKRLETFMETDAKACHWFVGYYLKHVWHNSNDLVFRDKASANKFLRILKQLKIGNEYIHLIWYHGKKVSGIPTKERVQYWRSGLKLGINRSIKRTKLNQESNLGKYGWFAIRLDDYINTDRQHNQANCAFRFSIVMYSILTSRVQ